MSCSGRQAVNLFYHGLEAANHSLHERGQIGAQIDFALFLWRPELQSIGPVMQCQVLLKHQVIACLPAVSDWIPSWPHH